MSERVCPNCGSELARSRRPESQATPLIGSMRAPCWRCGVCGGEFTAEEIRDGKQSAELAPVFPSKLGDGYGV